MFLPDESQFQQQNFESEFQPIQNEQDKRRIMPTLGQQMKETTVISQTNPKFNIEELKHLLRGEEESIDDNGKSKWIKNADTKPLINELGIKSLLTDLFGANQGVAFSNFEEDNLLAIVRNKGYILVDKLGENASLWEIEQGNLNTILYAILDTILATYRRGMNQGERIFVKTFYTENNTQVTRPIEMPQQRKKFLGIF